MLRQAENKVIKHQRFIEYILKFPCCFRDIIPVIYMRKEYDKLITAVPYAGIPGRKVTHSLSEFLQHTVTHLMAVGIIDRLEVI